MDTMQDIEMDTMQEIKISEVQKIASLAKLHFSDVELESIRFDITNIMSMINQLHELDCSNVKSLESVSDMHQRLYDDNVDMQNTVSDLFENVQGVNKDLSQKIKCFVVPKVIE